MGRLPNFTLNPVTFGSSAKDLLKFRKDFAAEILLRSGKRVMQQARQLFSS